MRTKKGITVFLLAFLLCVSSAVTLLQPPKADAVELVGTYDFSVAAFPDGTSALEYYGATTPTWTDAAFTTNPQSIAGITVREPIIILTRRTNLRSSNALTLASPIAADVFDENTYLTFRIFVNFSKSAGYGAIDFRIYGLDSDGSTAESGFKLPAVTQKTWVDVTVPTAQVGTLLSDDGTLKGVKIGCFTTTVVEADGHMWPTGAWMSIDSVSVYTKGTQSALSVNEVDAIYGDTVSLSVTGGSGTGAVTYEIVEGGTGTALLSGNQLTITKAGTIKVKALKAGDDDYLPAESSVLTITAEAITDNAIVWENAPATRNYNGEAMIGSATAAFGTPTVQFYAWDNDSSAYESDALLSAPSEHGKYKAVATVEGTSNYNGDTDEIEFLITVPVTVTDVSFTGTKLPGETLTFTPDAAPAETVYNRMEIKIGDGEFSTLEGTTYVLTTSAIEVRAIYVGDEEYEITLGSGVASYVGTPKFGQTITLTAATAPIGKELDYFTVDGESIGIGLNSFSMPNSDITVAAVFKFINYTVTQTGGVSYSGTTNYGQIITLSATAPVGKELDYYTVDDVPLGVGVNTFTMPAKNVTVSAVYKFITYTITETELSASGTAQFGQTITLTADTAPAGKEFGYFIVDGEKISGNTFTMPAKNISASVFWIDIGEKLFSVSDFPVGVSAQTSFGATTPSTWTDAAFAVQNKSMGGFTVTNVPVILLKDQTYVRSSNALLLDTPVAASALNEDSYLSVRIFIYLSSGTAFSGKVDIRLYGLDADGSGNGVRLPLTTTQRTWVEWKIPASEAAQLLSDNGTLEGLKLCCNTTTVLAGAGGHFLWGDTPQAWMAIDKIQVVQKPEQASLIIDSLTDAHYGTTLSLSATGGSGEGEVRYQVVSGPAVITGNSIKFNDVGEVKIKAIKAADSDYRSAESEIVTVFVTESNLLSSVMSASLSGDNLNVTLTSDDLLDSFEYQYWIRERVTTDTQIGNAVVYQYKWIMVKGYGEEGTKTASIPVTANSADECGNYRVLVRIRSVAGFICEITRSFTAAEAGEIALTSVTVEGIDTNDDMYVLDLSGRTTVTIKAEAQNFDTATLYEGNTLKASSDNGTLSWDVSDLSEGAYNLNVKVSGSAGEITRAIKIYLYNEYDVAVMPVINGIDVVRNGNVADVEIDSAFANGTALPSSGYNYTLNVNGKQKYESTTNIFEGVDIAGYGIYEMTATVSRSGISGSDDVYMYYYYYNRAVVPTVTLESDKTSVEKGGTVTFTASCIIEDEAVQYKFVRYDASGWVTVKSYSDSGTFVWKPSLEGNYQFMVYAKGESAGSYEAIASKTVTVTGDSLSGTLSVSAYDFSTGAEADGLSAGKPCIIRASYSEDIPVLYRFLVWDAGRKTIIGQSYGPDNTYTFIPRKPDTYVITVQAISINSFGYATISRTINSTVA